VYYTIWFAQNERDSVTYYYALITSRVVRIFGFNKAIETEIHACLIRHFIRNPAYIGVYRVAQPLSESSPSLADLFKVQQITNRAQT